MESGSALLVRRSSIKASERLDNHLEAWMEVIE